MMALDDVVSSQTTGPRVEEAMYRTLRWIDRCIAAHERPKEQNLFGIVQGGLDAELRAKCAHGLVERNLPGYAIGSVPFPPTLNFFHFPPSPSFFFLFACGRVVYVHC